MYFYLDILWRSGWDQYSWVRIHLHCNQSKHPSAEMMACDAQVCHVMHRCVMWCTGVSCDALVCNVMHRCVMWCTGVSCDALVWHSHSSPCVHREKWMSFWELTLTHFQDQVKPSPPPNFLLWLESSVKCLCVWVTSHLTNHVWVLGCGGEEGWGREEGWGGKRSSGLG